MRGAREAPAPRDSLNFRRAFLLSRNEFESGTFTIVLHATSSFTYVSVIYGANFSFNSTVGLQTSLHILSRGTAILITYTVILVANSFHKKIIETVEKITLMKDKLML